MAKKATSKPAARAVKEAAAAPVLPAPNGPAQTPEQGMTASLSAEGHAIPSAGSPAEGSGVLPPQAPLSEIVVGSGRVVIDNAGHTYEEGDIEEVAATVDRETSQAATAPFLEFLAQEEKSRVEAVHPAIEAARSYITPHGVPTGNHHYYTPPPPDLRSRKAKR